MKETTTSFGDRNSLSKTDRGATFVQMKEDHMKNGQLKTVADAGFESEDTYCEENGRLRLIKPAKSFLGVAIQRTRS